MRGRKNPDLGEAEDSTITENLVNFLAGLDVGAKSGEVAVALEMSIDETRPHLVALEKIGCVSRTGQTRGTRWWIG